MCIPCIVLINIIMLLVQCSSKEADFANTQEMVSSNLLYCHHYIFISFPILTLLYSVHCF